MGSASPFAEAEARADATLNTRFVLFSNTAGVYMGDDAWSYALMTHGSSKATVPTFTREEANGVLAKSLVTNAVAVRCFPDRPDNRASEDAVANAALPRWSE